MDFFLQYSTITEVPKFHLHLQVKKLKLKCYTCMHMCVSLQSSPSNLNVVVQEDQRTAVTAIFQERITARYFISGDLGICFEGFLYREWGSCKEKVGHETKTTRKLWLKTQFSLVLLQCAERGKKEISNYLQNWFKAPTQTKISKILRKLWEILFFTIVVECRDFINCVQDNQ